jgi:D-3-phosphoglycerate dehydrogenase
MDNVVVVPHLGSNTCEALDRMSLHAAMEIDRVLSGQKPLWPLNSPKGIV